MIKKKPRTDDAPAEAPTAPERIKLTNKAGGGATVLAEHLDIWLSAGWYRA
jgi:hypothetical protein